MNFLLVHVLACSFTDDPSLRCTIYKNGAPTALSLGFSAGDVGLVVVASSNPIVFGDLDKFDCAIEWNGSGSGTQSVEISATVTYKITNPGIT